jgi:hypothetical protein
MEDVDVNREEVDVDQERALPLRPSPRRNKDTQKKHLNIYEDGSNNAPVALTMAGELLIVVTEVVPEPEEVEKEARLCGLSRNFCYPLLSAVAVAVGVVVGVAVTINQKSPIVTATLAPTVYTSEAPTASLG